MSLSVLTIATMIRLSAEAGHEAAVPPIAVGGFALFILLSLLGALVAFGGGREHS